MDSSKIFYCSCGEHGSNTWPSDLQSNALPSYLSLQSGNERFNIRVAYINFRKYCFMVFFIFARDHEQLCQLFVEFACLFHFWSSTLLWTCYFFPKRTTLLLVFRRFITSTTFRIFPNSSISNMLHIIDLIMTQINFNLIWGVVCTNQRTNMYSFLFTLIFYLCNSYNRH